jgi:hypothetical protein
MIIANVNFLKELVVFLMGLALTSAAETTATLGAEHKLDWQVGMLRLLLVLNIIRFFYGNWMYLDKLESQKPKSGQVRAPIDKWRR